ncbi:MAG: class I SAM-dependent methyltransferase [Vicinamibacterales bacterium]
MVAQSRSFRRVFDPLALTDRLRRARARRAPLAAGGAVTAYRVADGAGDDLPGMAIDRLGEAAVLALEAGHGVGDRDVTALAGIVLRELGPDGVAAVYVKHLMRDRSRLGGCAPDEARSAVPRAGRPLPETLVVREYDARYEVRPYDGLSTGLFLEHREHRRALAGRPPGRALNLFAYTCAFSVPLAAARWQVTNVDVSGRALEWGRRNLALNGLPPEAVRFLRRDARAFLASAARGAERFDLVILDPPTFGAADRRRGIPAWRAAHDYPALLQAAAMVLAPGGAIFAATNTRELASGDVLARLVADALGGRPRRLPLPPWPLDVTAPGRVAAVLVSP